MLHGNRIFVFFAPSKTKCVDKHKPFEADEMPSSGHRLVQKRRKPPRNRELSTRQIVANLTSIDGADGRIRTGDLILTKLHESASFMIFCTVFIVTGSYAI